MQTSAILFHKCNLCISVIPDYLPVNVYPSLFEESGPFTGEARRKLVSSTVTKSGIQWTCTMCQTDFLHGLC